MLTWVYVINEKIGISEKTGIHKSPTKQNEMPSKEKQIGNSATKEFQSQNVNYDL